MPFMVFLHEMAIRLSIIIIVMSYLFGFEYFMSITLVWIASIVGATAITAVVLWFTGFFG